MKPIEKKVYETILPYTDEQGLEIYDVIYEKQGRDMYLSIYIDKPEGISIEDCENLNNIIDSVIEEKIDIKEKYFLEISSPGLERRIRDDDQLKKYLNTKISVNLFKPIDKVKELIGTLKKYTESSITLATNEKEYVLDRKDISLIKTVYDWDNEGGNLENEQ